MALRHTLLPATFAFALGVINLSPLAAFAVEKDETSEEHSEDIVRRASSIARQTMSPFCPGRTLSDCPSEYATEWRRDIRDMVAKGMTAAEIQRALEKRAGNNLSGIPNRESSYLVPISLTFGAAIVLGLVLMRLTRRGESEPTKKAAAKKKNERPVSEVDDARLDAELQAEEPDD